MAEAPTQSTSTVDLMQYRIQELQAEKVALEASTADLRAQRDAKHGEVDAINVTIRDLTAQIDAIERPRIIELSEEISRLAQATGGKSMGRPATTE